MTFLIFQSVISLGQKIDLEKSSISFTFTHFGMDIIGDCTEFTANLEFDQSNIENSTVEISIPAKLITTGGELRDKHLKCEEFFDVDSHPLITFNSEVIKAKGSELLVHGTLLIKGVEKKVVIPMKFEDDLFIGEFNLLRRDYNVGGTGFLDPVGKEILIQFNIVLE